jgi:hypothetical protein
MSYRPYILFSVFCFLFSAFCLLSSIASLDKPLSEDLARESA